LINNILISLFDFFLPRLCVVCEIKISVSEIIICSDCYANFEIATKTRIQNEFKRKFTKEKLIADFLSAFIFHNDSEIQKLIHSLKYDQNFLVGKFLGGKTAEILNSKINYWNADLILPVPLHSLRKAERGFNQACEIAKGISRRVNVPLKLNILKRNRFTKTQTKLNLLERKKNIVGAFKLNKKKKINGKTIILVDDVITTGATISECARILMDNGAKRIYAISVAIAD
jgi:competence protein ComFC